MVAVGDNHPMPLCCLQNLTIEEALLGRGENSDYDINYMSVVKPSRITIEGNRSVNNRHLLIEIKKENHQ